MAVTWAEDRLTYSKISSPSPLLSKALSLGPEDLPLVFLLRGMDVKDVPNEDASETFLSSWSKSRRVKLRSTFSAICEVLG